MLLIRTIITYICINRGCFRPPAWYDCQVKKQNKYCILTITSHFDPKEIRKIIFDFIKSPKISTFLGLDVHLDNFEMLK